MVQVPCLPCSTSHFARRRNPPRPVSYACSIAAGSSTSDAAGGKVGAGHVRSRSAVWRPGRAPARSRRRRSRPRCAAGWRSPCRPRCRRRHWRADWESRRAGPRGSLFLAVVGGAEIDRIVVDAGQQRLRHFGQPRFGVSHRRGVIAVDVAEIALAFHQRIAHREILRQPHQRVVDRGIAVRMVLADHVAHHARAFLEARGGIEPQLVHGVDQPPVHRLQPVAHVRQRARHDGGERVGEVPLAQRLRQRACPARRPISCHQACVASPPAARRGRTAPAAPRGNGRWCRPNASRARKCPVSAQPVAPIRRRRPRRRRAASAGRRQQPRAPSLPAASSATARPASRRHPREPRRSRR